MVDFAGGGWIVIKHFCILAFLYERDNLKSYKKGRNWKCVVQSKNARMTKTKVTQNTVFKASELTLCWTTGGGKCTVYMDNVFLNHTLKHVEPFREKKKLYVAQAAAVLSDCESTWPSWHFATATPLPAVEAGSLSDNLSDTFTAFPCF